MLRPVVRPLDLHAADRLLGTGPGARAPPRRCRQVGRERRVAVDEDRNAAARSSASASSALTQVSALPWSRVVREIDAVVGEAARTADGGRRRLAHVGAIPDQIVIAIGLRSCPPISPRNSAAFSIVVVAVRPSEIWP